jgi:chemotaxis family two-component system response regulator Rcp1
MKNMSMMPSHIDVLLVEDNPIDIMVTRKALEEGGYDIRLHVVEDGEKALAFINENCNPTDANLFCPDLILLDLNLHKKSGREVLREIRSNPDTRRIPVIILTTSAEEEDIKESYSQSANCYIVKPIGVDSFTNAIKSIGDFWTHTAKLPSSPN